MLFRSRWLGHDEDERPCFVRQCFSLPIGEGAEGQGQVPAQALAHGEDLMAWRLRDGRWLIHRVIVSQAETAPQQYSFYALGHDMPR